MVVHLLMDIKKGVSGLILAAMVLGFSVSASSGNPVYAGKTGNETNPASTYDLSTADFLPSDTKDGAYTAKITVPAFDQAKLYWDSTGDPEFSMRVCETSDPESSNDSENWSDWQNFMESGQTYLRNISGLFSLNLFSSEPEKLAIEIRSDNFENANPSNIRLELASEKKDLRSTISMIVVMLAAGGALYIKKRRMVQN